MTLQNCSAMRRGLYILAAVAASGLVSCGLDNDMSLPKNHADFTVFEVFGQVSSKIDANSCTVNIVLDEDVYVNDLNIKTVQFSEGTRCQDPAIADGRKIDLTSPYQVTLSVFRDFKWTISAEQPVERYVKCDKMVGEATIFPDTRKISIKVKPNVGSAIDSRSNLVINDMKLGLKRSRIISTTDMHGNVQTISSFPVTLDCFNVRRFTVEQDGETSEWTLIALPSE